MLSNTAWLTRSVVRDFQEEVQSTDRFVDIGVLLHVVRRDPSGEELIAGKPRLSRVGKPLRFGGVIDTKLDTPARIGPSKNPQHWYCSEQQLPIILHGADCNPGQLVEGGMGAGKTTLGVMWTYLRWLEHLGQFREGAITAPTEARLDVVLREVFGLFPKSWYRYSSGTNLITLCDRTLIRGVSTYRQSASQGSRVQGYNWSWLFADELQDQIEEFVNSIARLRSGRESGAPRLGTATAKDAPAYRDLKDKLAASGDWTPRRLLGPDSPFVHADHWESMKRLTTDRDYRRLVLAEDLPPESRLYNAFDRRFNLKQLPILHAKKVTSLVISKKVGGVGWGVGIGHDPGAAKAASVWCDAYMLPRHIAEAFGAPHDEHVWFARRELFTHQESVEQHAVKALKITQAEFGCNLHARGEHAHVRCQPLGSAEDKPDLSTLAVWRRIGFDIRVAKYSKAGQGVGQIKKEDRFSVVNTLFCNAYGKRRLFLEVDEHGQCRTPLLLAALEAMERDDKGRGEHEEKDIRHDRSDLPAALGYWLYPWEKELALALRADIKRAL